MKTNTPLKPYDGFLAFFLAVVTYGVFGRLLFGILEGKGLHALGYFTIQSNLLVFLFLLQDRLMRFGLWKGKNPPPAVHGAILVYISATGLIYNVLLAPIDTSTGILWYYSFINHTVTPLLFLLDWIIRSVRRPYPWSMLGWYLLYPVGYAVYGMIEGALTGGFRYFFLDYSRPLDKFATGFILVVACFLVLASLVILTNRLLIKKDVQK